jgi:hypothetical protein
MSIDYIYVRCYPNDCAHGDINSYIREKKIRTDITFTFDNDGRLLCNNKCDRISTTTEFDTLLQILLAISKQSNYQLTGNFAYTSNHYSYYIHTVSYLFKDYIVKFLFEIDENVYSEENMEKAMVKTVVRHL